MPVKFLLYGSDNVMIDKGSLSELPAIENYIIGDVITISGIPYILRSNGSVVKWEELPSGYQKILSAGNNISISNNEISSTVDTTNFVTQDQMNLAISGFLSEDEIDALLNDLDTAMTKNATELSIQERNTVIEMVNSAIADIPTGVTTSQIQTMIDTALASLEMPLTEEQIQAIVNESVKSVNVYTIPDYGNMQVILMTENFAPYGSEGTKGTSYIMQKDGFIVVSGRYALTLSGTLPVPAWWATQYLVNNMVVGRSYIYFTQIGTIPFYFTSNLIPVSAGDEISLSGDASRSDFNILAVTPSSINIYYYPIQNGNINTSQNDLSTFATLSAMTIGDAENADTIDNHKETDRFRWQDDYNDKLESIIRDAANIGLIPDKNNIVHLDNPSSSFSVNDEAGGVLGVTMRNINETYSVITITGTQSVTYSSDGLFNNVPIIKYFWLKVGDTVSSTNVESYEYIPFTSDPTAIIPIMQNQVVKNQNSISNLTNVVYDIQAGITGKILDTSNAVDIANTSYTITNSLGGRLSGVGFTTIGLLGIRLVSTGIVSITEVSSTSTNVYDNTSVLAVGEADPFIYDVKLGGTVVNSSGMANLTFTPYKLGSE